MMNYPELLADIFGRGRFGMKPGLERISLILERLGNPHEMIRAVQIAGTNGKGSSGAFLSGILTRAGYRTAYFSSPHLNNFTERFRINDLDLSEEAVYKAAQRVMAVVPDDATFFEIVTAIAFQLFADEKAELVIMEAGMGGRYDATNVARPIVSVITPISLDHCTWLGGTLEEIATEKAGIIKPGAPLVTAHQEEPVLKLLISAAEAAGVPAFRFGTDFAVIRQGETLHFTGFGRDVTCKPALAGGFQAENLGVAVATALLLERYGFKVSDEAVISGAACARWPGRMELFHGNPRILLDGAHNPAGVQALLQSLDELEYERLILVTGVMGDKDWQSVVSPLAERADRVVAVYPSIDRAVDPSQIAAFCNRNGVDAVAAGSVSQGLELARSFAGGDDLLLVAGSLFTVGEARGILTGSGFMPIRG